MQVMTLNSFEANKQNCLVNGHLLLNILNCKVKGFEGVKGFKGDKVLVVYKVLLM